MDDDQARELEALEGILSDPSAEPIKLSYGLLKFITENFSNEIGRGGFGVVYQGGWQNWVVAVKKTSNAQDFSDKLFMDEIKCLKNTNHKNIVRFLSYRADTQEEIMPLDGTFVMAGERNRLLCFEYVPKGNVRQYLEQDKPHGDDWLVRYQMIRGICHGLQYLHDKQINHLDLKPENVMLDADLEAKITDFGLSRLLDEGQSKMITKRIIGTLRYIAPEVIDKGEISFKSDIYALGIIIIELLTGTSMISLENWDELLEVLDCPRVRRCTEIARNCTDADKDKRPTVSEVISDLDELESMIPRLSINQGAVPSPSSPPSIAHADLVAGTTVCHGFGIRPVGSRPVYDSDVEVCEPEILTDPLVERLNLVEKENNYLKEKLKRVEEEKMKLELHVVDVVDLHKIQMDPMRLKIRKIRKYAIDNEAWYHYAVGSIVTFVAIMIAFVVAFKCFT